MSCPIHHTVPCPIHHPVPCPIHHTMPCPIHHTVPCPIHHTVPVYTSAGLVIERSGVRIPAGTAGVFSSPGSTFCAAAAAPWLRGHKRQDLRHQQQSRVMSSLPRENHSSHNDNDDHHHAVLTSHSTKAWQSSRTRVKTVDSQLPVSAPVGNAYTTRLRQGSENR